jgi:hypothetical protein
MEFLEAHWHCILPLIGVVAYLLCTKKDSSEPQNTDDGKDGDSR